MDVRSVYNSGLTGFQNASLQLSNAGSRIAGAPSAPAENQAASQSRTPSAERTPVSLSTELVNVKVAEFQAKASAKVICTADDMLGTLIDTRV